jgi:hypothetical protein
MFDLDPGRWRPLYYGVEIDVGVAEGAIGRGSLHINRQPFIFTQMAHKIIGNTADPATSGLYQDGMYDLAFRDEQSNYQNIPIPADLMFGSWGSGGDMPTGFMAQLTYPIPFPGSKNVTFEITNRIARTLTPSADTFPVFICLGGVSDWGKLASPVPPPQQWPPQQG